MRLCFLVYLSLLSLASFMAVDDMIQGYQIAKPGCPDECGGVKIPFPFGIQDGCFFNSSTSEYDNAYKIICDNTTGKPVPVLASQVGDSENQSVLSINLANHSLRVSTRVAYACYRDGESLDNFNNSSYKLDAMPFTNSAKNRLVAIGCDTTARVQDDGRPQAYFTGCMTSCVSVDDVTDGICSGLGCCEASIPPRIHELWVYVDSVRKHDYVQYFNPCSFAFVSEEGGYKFSSADLKHSESEYQKIRASALLDWYVFTDEKCNSSENVLCGLNTECIDVHDVNFGYVNFGYRCKCSQGYLGNPYLAQGCQDINECLDGRLNECEKPAYCANRVGGYDCKCPSGFHGNATKHSPCIARPAAAKLVTLGLSISFGTILLLLFLVGLYILFQRRKDVIKRRQNFKRNGGFLLQQQLSASEGAVERTKIFSRDELEKATDNFNDNRVLGRGGQGTVYKGMLEDGTIVAVKRSKKVDENQLAQFINEVIILSQINHRNVVKLFGCCLETEVPMLVYEFVSNGTLYQHIHNPSEDFQVTWKMRFRIAVECAGALAYLHSSSSSPVYHRDIKSSNILLDEKYKAKISDFGTSKTVSIDQTHVTTCVQGTFGYLDPEFFQSSQFTEKSDVYSFGVVLLELVTSKKPISTDTSKESRSLAAEFLQLVENSPDNLYHILDNQVLQGCSKEEIKVLVKLIKQCLSLNGKQRPTMKEVAMTLEIIRSQHDQAQVAKSPIEKMTKMQEKHGWTDQSMTNYEGPSSITSTSASTDNSNSMDVQPLLFNSI